MVVRLRVLIKKIIFLALSVLSLAFTSKGKARKSNYTCFIRLDAIGDYVLFRNFVEEYKRIKNNGRCVLIGNEQWRDLAEKLDSNIYDHFIWIDNSRLWSDFSYFIKKLKRCASIVLIYS